MEKSKYKTLIIRGKTNEGNPAKQYCVLAEDKSKDFEKAVIIKRLVLTEDLYSYIATQHYLLRRFKGKYLMGKSFSFKISTLSTILEWSNELNKP